MSRIKRRRLLEGIISTATVGLLAGCSGDNEDDTGNGDNEDDTGNGDNEDDTGNGDTGYGNGGSEDTESEDTESSTLEPETVLVGPEAQNVFEPDSLEIEQGTEVTFVWESSGHSLVVDSQPDGADWGGVPDTQSTGHEHVKVFEVPGTYDYYCEPHQTFGMEGTITVEGT